MQRNDGLLLRTIAVVTGLLYAAILADALIFNGELRLRIASFIARVSEPPDRRPSRPPGVAAVIERARQLAKESDLIPDKEEARA